MTKGTQVPNKSVGPLRRRAGASTGTRTSIYDKALKEAIGVKY